MLRHIFQVQPPMEGPKQQTQLPQYLCLPSESSPEDHSPLEQVTENSSSGGFAAQGQLLKLTYNGDSIWGKTQT